MCVSAVEIRQNFCLFDLTIRMSGKFVNVKCDTFFFHGAYQTETIEVYEKIEFSFATLFSTFCQTPYNSIHLIVSYPFTSRRIRMMSFDKCLCGFCELQIKTNIIHLFCIF